MFKLICIGLLTIFCIFGQCLAKVYPDSFPVGLVPMLDGRIVGGEDVSIQEYPHQISLRHLMMHRCGGSIIKAHIVLTAAHCVDGIMFQNFLRVRAGTSDKSKKGIDMKVDKVIVHDQYHATTVDNDIALVITKDSFTYSAAIQPINLPQSKQDYPEATEAMVSGWGATSEGGFSSKHLKAVAVSIVKREDCGKSYEDMKVKVTENMICAGGRYGVSDACQGDSGGPLITVNKENNDTTLIGIVSWGYGCARPTYPGVYTKVSQYLFWIDIRSHYF